jgi:hypothetical protein
MVFTLDKHNKTNAQQAIIDSIMMEYAHRLNRRFLGVDKFLAEAPEGEKMVFRWDGKAYVFSEFQESGMDLGHGGTFISTHYGSVRERHDDFYDVRSIIENETEHESVKEVTF